MKKGIAIMLICSLLVLSAGCSSKVKNTAAGNGNQKQQDTRIKLDKLFMDYFGSDKFSGYVYITKKGTLLLDKGYGRADFDKGTENTKQTRFDIASLTKQFTAFAIMQLEGKKLLSVNDKVSKFLPAFPHGGEITIHQLLCHASGLPEHSIDFDITKFRPSAKNFGTIGKDEKANLSFTPGTAFQYSNTGYILLGYIIEKVSGKTLDLYFDENIFKPLNMNNTGFKDKNGELNNLAAGYQTENKDKAEKSWTFLNVGPVLGNSGLCSTVEDLIKWDKALTEQKLLSRESYNKLYTPNEKNYGYGWYINKDSAGKISCWHFGSASGYRSYIFRAPDENSTIIIVSNYQNIPIEDMSDIINEYLGQF